MQPDSPIARGEGRWDFLIIIWLSPGSSLRTQSLFRAQGTIPDSMLRAQTDCALGSFKVFAKGSLLPLCLALDHKLVPATKTDSTFKPSFALIKMLPSFQPFLIILIFTPIVTCRKFSLSLFLTLQQLNFRRYADSWDLSSLS